MTTQEAEQVRTIAANIEHLISIRGWTWTRLAEVAEVSQPTISRLKNAKFEPGVFTMQRIANVLDTSMEWLCEPHEAKKFAAAS